MLREWLKSSKTRQSHVCELLSLSPGYVSELVNKTKKPSLDVALKFQIFTNGGVCLSDWYTESEIAALRAEIAASVPAGSETVEPMREAS